MPDMSLAAGCDREPEVMSCGRCGAQFTCGPQQPGGHCWCYHVPHFMPGPGDSDKCLCPSCLDQALRAGRPRAQA